MKDMKRREDPIIDNSAAAVERKENKGASERSEERFRALRYLGFLHGIIGSTLPNSRIMP